MPALRTLSPTAITDAARKEIAALGAAGLTVRGTARRLGVTAPALYHYFPRLDDLITAVVVETLDELRDTLDAAEQACPSEEAGERVLAVCRAFREWALANPVGFQLAFEEPIAGYRPPQQISRGKAREPFLGLIGLFARAHAAGELRVPPEYRGVPSSIAQELATWREETGLRIPDAVVCLIASGWARLHGLVALELFGQMPGLVGDAHAFFEYELRAFARRLGLSLVPSPSERTAS